MIAISELIELYIAESRTADAMKAALALNRDLLDDFHARATLAAVQIVRNELVDALLLAEQLRLGSTPEVLLQDDADLLTARYYSRAARDLAQQINRKKNQLRALLRAYCPPLSQVFPGSKLHHPAVYALLQEHLFPDELVDPAPHLL